MVGYNGELEKFLLEKRSKIDSDKYFSSWMETCKKGEFEGKLLAWIDFIKNKRSNSGGHISQSSVCDFFVELIDGENYVNILDPACGTGFLLSKVAEKCQSKNVLGIEYNSEIFEIAEKEHLGYDFINTDSAIINYSSDYFIHKEFQKFDLIISELPLGINNNNYLENEWLGIQIRDSAFNIMVNCLEYLSCKGKAIFSVSGSFFWRNDGIQIMDELKEKGFFIDAVFNQKNSRLNTQLSTNIVVISREKNDNIFLAECSINSDVNKKVFSNYKHRKEDKKFFENGLLVERDNFKGYESESRYRELIALTEKRGFYIPRFDEIVVKYDFFDIKNKDEYEKLPNSVFFHLLFPKLIYQHIDEIERKTGTICNIQFNQKMIHAPLLKNIYNKEMIEAIFSCVAKGNTHIRISRMDIPLLKFPIPSLEQGNEISEYIRKVNNARDILNELENMIYYNFNNSKNQITILDNFGSFDSWFETLPFPLATLLKRFSIEEDKEKKCKLLLEFFESLAAILGIIHLSARWSDLEGNSELKDKIKKTLVKNKLSLDRVTFGFWCQVVNILSTDSEKMYDNLKTKRLISDKYCTKDRQILDFLFSKDVRIILGKANKIRNDLNHHRKSPDDLDVLNNLLNQVKSKIERSFANYELVYPLSGLYDEEGYFKASVRCLNGHSSVWPKRVYETHSKIKSNSLYFHSKYDKRSLELLPLIVLKSSPPDEKNAIYLHNKFSSEKQVLVANHLTESTEIELSFDSKIIQIINEFSQG